MLARSIDREGRGYAKEFGKTGGFAERTIWKLSSDYLCFPPEVTSKFYQLKGQEMESVFLSEDRKELRQFCKVTESKLTKVGRLLGSEWLLEVWG